MADPERIWLEPPPGDPDGRLWCKDDVWTGDPAYAQDGPPTEYVRADLHEQVIAAMGDAMGAATERFAEIMRLQGEAAALRAKVRALSGPLPSDPDGRMWSTLNYFANREDDDIDTEVMGWAMREITGLRTRVAELEAAQPKRLGQRTVAELQAEIGRLQAELHYRVCGDPREAVSITTGARRALGDGHG